MAWRKINDSLLAGIANAIRLKTGSVNTYTPNNMAAAIRAMNVDRGVSVPGIAKKDVNFYDCDGTLIHGYTIAEAALLSELPELPEQPGLICQEWNWSLEDIKASGRPVDVGATYITDDGKTRLYINIASLGRMDVPLRFIQSDPNGVMVDWGDGSAAQTYEGTTVITSHNYTNVGEYVITLDVAGGCLLALGEGTTGCSLFYGAISAYSNILEKVEIGERTIVSNDAFRNCYHLTNVTIPNGITSIRANTFYMCYSLNNITIPSSVEIIDTSAFARSFCLSNTRMPNSIAIIRDAAFNMCFSVTNVRIPDGVTVISSNAFSSCTGLISVIIPSGVTNISSNAFASCVSVKEYHLLRTTPPALPNKSAFGDIPSDCIIFVPAGCLPAYQNATNWAAYAGHMREEGT